MQTSTVTTPLHPEAVHQCSTIRGTVYHGWDDQGKRWKVYVCECGADFFYEPD